MWWQLVQGYAWPCLCYMYRFWNSFTKSFHLVNSSKGICFLDLCILASEKKKKKSCCSGDVRKLLSTKPFLKPSLFILTGISSRPTPPNGLFLTWTFPFWLCEIIALGSVSNSDDNAKNGTYHSLSLYVVNLKPQLHGTETVTAPWFAADRIQASRGVQGRSGMAVESGLELWLQVFPLAKEHQRPQEKQQWHGASMYFLHVSVQQSRFS